MTVVDYFVELSTFGLVDVVSVVDGGDSVGNDKNLFII